MFRSNSCMSAERFATINHSIDQIDCLINTINNINEKAAATRSATTPNALKQDAHKLTSLIESTLAEYKHHCRATKNPNEQYATTLEQKIQTEQCCIEELTRECEKYMCLSNQCEEKLQKLQEEYEATIARNSQLEEQVHSYHEKISEQLARAEEQHTRPSESVEVQTVEIENTSESTSQEAPSIIENKEIIEIEAVNERLTEQLEECNRENDRYKAHIQTLEESIQHLTEDNEQLKEEHEIEIEKNHQDIELIVEEYEDRVESGMKREEQLNHEVASLHSRVERLESCVDAEVNKNTSHSVPESMHRILVERLAEEEAANVAMQYNYEALVNFLSTQTPHYRVPRRFLEEIGNAEEELEELHDMLVRVKTTREEDSSAKRSVEDTDGPMNGSGKVKTEDFAIQTENKEEPSPAEQVAHEIAVSPGGETCGEEECKNGGTSKQRDLSEFKMEYKVGTTMRIDEAKLKQGSPEDRMEYMVDIITKSSRNK